MLSLVIAPTEEPLTLTEARRQLLISLRSADPNDDDWLNTAIASARERGEGATGRAFITQTWDYTLDEFPRENFIEIPKAPLISVTSVTYTQIDGTSIVWPSTEYLVEAPSGPRAARGRVSLKFSGVWPIALQQRGAIVIRFVAGYGAAAAVPAMLKSAMKLDLATLYANREDVIRGTIVAALPNAAKDIYWTHRSHGVQRLAV